MLMFCVLCSWCYYIVYGVAPFRPWYLLESSMEYFKILIKMNRRKTLPDYRKTNPYLAVTTKLFFSVLFFSFDVIQIEMHLKWGLIFMTQFITKLLKWMELFFSSLLLDGLKFATVNSKPMVKVWIEARKPELIQYFPILFV